MVQLNNILHFHLLFQLSTTLQESSIDYIFEKYNAMIGFDPMEGENETEDFWQSVCLTNLDALEYKIQWARTWLREKNKLEKNKERILNYLCIIEAHCSRGMHGTKPTGSAIHHPLLLRQTRRGSPSPSIILNFFEKYIGNTKNVNNFEYKHLHPHFIEIVDKYKKFYLREINLEVLERIYR